MELPDWVIDEVLAPAKPAAFRLTVMLFRHGRPQVDHATGGRRVYWRGTTQALARLTGLNKKSVITAEQWLGEVGFLTSHRSTRPNAPHAISAPLEKGGGNFSHSAESGIARSAAEIHCRLRSPRAAEWLPTLPAA